jgi:enterochelin esterase family protein
LTPKTLRTSIQTHRILTPAVGNIGRKSGVKLYMQKLGLLLFVMPMWAAVPPSPQIKALEATVRSQGPAVVETFWKQVAENGGTPLIECPASLKPDCLVTFLWRGDASTRNVVIRGEALPEPPSENLFDRVAGTDVWYRTYRFREDARFMYMLSIDDPLTPWEVEGAEARRKRYAGLRGDPMNPRGYASLPKAPSERWAQERPGVAKGEMSQHTFVKTGLSGARTVDVYRTPGFRAGQGPSAVLIVFDGDEAENLTKVPIILDNLFAEARIPPMAAVFLLQPYEQREADLGCSRSMNRFLVNELMPWLGEQHGIRTEAGHVIVAGASLGGLAATFAALEHPEIFGRVLSQSGAFWWGRTDSEREWLTAELASRPRRDVKFYLDVGLMETKGGVLSQIETNRRIVEVLRQKGYDVVLPGVQRASRVPLLAIGVSGRVAFVAVPLTVSPRPLRARGSILPWARGR